MMTFNLKSTMFAAFVLIFASACTNPEKLIERGDFDQALTLSAKKLSGKKKKKEKYVKAMEEAFERATSLDMRQAKSLEKEGRSENWVEINRIYKKIQRRQDLIEPLLPLYDKDGYKANFKFVKIDGLVSESKEKAANFYYIEGKRMLAQGERGDKEAAREAFRNFERIGQYFNQYRDESELMKKAHELGTVYVLLKMQNASNVILPKDFEREIKRISTRDLESLWRVVHVNKVNNKVYDYDVVMSFNHIDVTPEIVREREYVDEKTVEDGWQYVLDLNGNVLKDSLGNDVKETRYSKVYADVLETLQTKSAIVSGELEFFDNTNGALIHREPITAEAIFENYAATFRGDKRALSKESKDKIGNSPVPFPTNEMLVLQAADILKPVIKKKIKRGLG